MTRLENNRIKREKIIILEERSWIITHLGENPKNGGKPPRERRFIGRRRLSRVLFLFWLIKSEIEEDWVE